MRILIALFVISINLVAQEYITVIDEKYNEPTLIGVIEKAQLESPDFSYWFEPEYEEYEVDTTELKPIDGLLDANEITIVMGTWCGDSHREIPRFFKILEYLNVSPENVEMIAVDRDKKGINDEVNGLEIELVPTFIIKTNQNEVGRIVESPIISLEADLVNILKKNTPAKPGQTK